MSIQTRDDDPDACAECYQSLSRPSMSKTDWTAIRALVEIGAESVGVINAFTTHVTENDYCAVVARRLNDATQCVRRLFPEAFATGMGEETYCADRLDCPDIGPEV